MFSSRRSLVGAVVGAMLVLGSFVPAVAAPASPPSAPGAAQTSPRDDYCPDDFICFYEYTDFEVLIRKIEYPKPGKCYDLNPLARSAINRLYGKVAAYADYRCRGDVIEIAAHSEEEDLPPRRSFKFL